MNHLINFFYMDGYGYYVFTAYTSVAICLGMQWLISWRRWHNALKSNLHE